MDENEIMTNEEVMNEEPEVVEKKSGMGTRKAMLIGGLIATGVIAGLTKLKQMHDQRKALKELPTAKDSEDSEGAEPEESEDPANE